MTQQVLIIATHGFEQSELEKPKEALEKAGYKTVVASPEEGQIKGWEKKDWGRPVKVDATLDTIRADDFAGLVLPGGQMNPDALRLEDQAISLVRQFARSGKPVAAICHGPWLLVEADVVKGKTVTSWPSIRTDLRNAGATVVDQEVAVHENLITSRNPGDIPAFCDALIGALQEQAVSA